MIIGVVGQIASGKGILVDYLTKKFGYRSFSLSSVVHDELKRRRIGRFDRQTLQDIGDDLRKRYGDDILARRISNTSNWSHKSNLVIEGIRNPGEIEYFKKNPDFVLIGVKAKKTLRFNRLTQRKKPWDPKTYQEFIKIDRRDLGVGQLTDGQQVGKCLAYCDHVLINNKDIKHFENKIEKLMRKLFKTVKY